MKTFRKGGIHPDDNKRTAGVPISEPVSAQTLTLLLSQSIGAPPKVIVKAGDRVEAGSLVAEPGGYVSAALHSPVGGVVKRVVSVRDPYGYPSQAIEIADRKSVV